MWSALRSLTPTSLFRQPVRFVTGGVERWWQPIIPALAHEIAPLTEGRGRSRTRMMQRKQQIVCMHARRREGVKRNQVVQMQKRAESRRRVAAVYEKFASILQSEAANKDPVSS